MKNKKFILGIAASLGAYVIWGFSFMASKVCQGHTSPFVLLAYRFDIALLLLSIPLILGKAKVRLKGKNILPLLLLGACEPCLYFIGEPFGAVSAAAIVAVLVGIWGVQKYSPQDETETS